MSRKSKLAGGLKGELHEVKNAGFAATKKSSVTKRLTAVRVFTINLKNPTGRCG